MSGIKNLFASKTILTSILGAVFMLLSTFGVVDVSPETQAAITTTLFTLAGIFRFTATTELTVS